MIFDNNKILIFPVWYGMGGSTMYVGQYVSYLVSNNHDVFVVCRKKDKGSNYLRNLGAKIIFVKFPFTMNFTAQDETNDSLRKRIIDVIKLFGGFFISLTIILIYRPGKIVIGEFCEIPVLLSASLFRKKTICFFQTSISKRKWKRIILFKLIKNVDQLVGITELHTMEIPYKEKILTVPNCYSFLKGNFPNSVLDQLSMGGEKLVLFMGGVCETKGTRHFIEIALELLKLRTDLCFIIAGSFHRSFKSKHAIGENNSEYNYNKIVFNLIGGLIDIKFKFLGEINYINDVLKRSDLFISTNTYPHFSRPIVEAWANKVPVVANEDLFIKHMCHNKESILLIDISQIDKAAKMINLLLNDKKKSENQIIAGYSNYESYYSKDVANIALDNLFKTIA
jgi:glycosyltransferase involved in cell wall biosynthesis